MLLTPTRPNGNSISLNLGFQDKFVWFAFWLCICTRTLIKSQRVGLGKKTICKIVGSYNIWNNMQKYHDEYNIKLYTYSV